MAGKSLEEQGAERIEAAKIKERRTVMNTKVPTHRTSRKNEREDEDVTFMGVNTNSLAYWSKDSNKAARLKYVFQEYGVDSAGLQEVCMNWAKVPQSKSLAKSLQEMAETICLIASHNKIEGKAKDMEYAQRGGTALVLREELAQYAIDSGVDPSGLGRWSWYQLEDSKGINTT